MGWRIKWYGPWVINVAPDEGKGKILNLLFFMDAIAQSTKRTDSRMKIAGNHQSWRSCEPVSNRNIKTNCRTTSTKDLMRRGIFNVSVKVKQPAYCMQAVIINISVTD